MKKIIILFFTILIINSCNIDLNNNFYKEFKIKSISERKIFWWLWNNTWDIWNITSIFITNENIYDFEIYEDNILENFKEKIYIKKINNSEIKICNSMNITKKCYNSKWTLVEKFIENNLKYNN